MYIFWGNPVYSLVILFINFRNSFIKSFFVCVRDKLWEISLSPKWLFQGRRDVGNSLWLLTVYLKVYHIYKIISRTYPISLMEKTGLVSSDWNRWKSGGGGGDTVQKMDLGSLFMCISCLPTTSLSFYQDPKAILMRCEQIDSPKPQPKWGPVLWSPWAACETFQLKLRSPVGIRQWAHKILSFLSFSPFAVMSYFLVS